MASRQLTYPQGGVRATGRLPRKFAPERGTVKSTVEGGFGYFGYFTETSCFGPCQNLSFQGQSVANKAWFGDKTTHPAFNLPRALDFCRKLAEYQRNLYTKTWPILGEAGLESAKRNMVAIRELFREKQVAIENLPSEDMYVTFVPKACWPNATNDLDTSIGTVLVTWGATEIENQGLGRNNTVRMQVNVSGLSHTKRTLEFKNPQLIFTMLYNPSWDMNETMCFMLQEQYTCDISAFTLVRPNMCTYIPSIEGAECNTWFGSLEQGQQDSIVTNFCNAWPDLPECSCLARTQIPIYQKMRSSFTSIVKDACWWQPCKVSDSTTVHATQSIRDQKCENDVCVMITNIENVTDSNIGDIEQYATCVEEGGEDSPPDPGPPSGIEPPSDSGSGPSVGGGAGQVTVNGVDITAVVIWGAAGVLLLAILAGFAYMYYTTFGDHKDEKQKKQKKQK